MFGEVVDGIDGAPLRGRARPRSSASAASRTTPISRPTTSPSSSRPTSAIYRERRATSSRRTRREQLLRAVRAVFDSWDTPRAQVYRRANDIPDDIGTAVNVVQMVFGNKGDRSGTGVAFTRDPSTGENGRLRRVPRQRAGRGRRRRNPHAAAARGDARDDAGGLRAAARRRSRRLEQHYRDMQDIEFTVEDGGSTCSRRARRSAPPPRR